MFSCTLNSFFRRVAEKCVYLVILEIQVKIVLGST